MDDTSVQVYNPGDIIDKDGRKYKVLSNGSLYDVVSHRIAAPPSPNNITSENAREYHAMRRAKLHKAIEKGIISGTKLKGDDVYQGLEIIAQRQAELAQDKDKGRASTEAFRLLLQSGGWMRKDTTDADDNSGRVILDLPQEALVHIALAILGR